MTIWDVYWSGYLQLPPHMAHNRKVISAQSGVAHDGLATSPLHRPVRVDKTDWTTSAARKLNRTGKQLTTTVTDKILKDS